MLDGLPLTMNSGDMDIDVVGGWQMNATLRINNTNNDVPVRSPAIQSHSAADIEVGGVRVLRRLARPPRS